MSESPRYGSTSGRSERRQHRRPFDARPPEGWHKKRHNVYPTTDLNIITDGFDDLDWLGDVLDRRLAPVISRVYGIPRRSLRAIDIFVVRYDADRQTKLSLHTDDGDVSFNVLLT